MPEVLIVLGMHRSGTSAVAGVLTRLGGAAPKTLYPSDYGNERGYFESALIMAFHDELLASAGTHWADWRAFDPGWRDSPVCAAFQQRAKRLFEEEFGDAPIAVLKDPRICRFLPFWLEVFAAKNVTPRIVIPVRSPLEVASSLHKRNAMPLPEGLLLWLRHVLDAEAASRTLPRSIVTWRAFVANWREAVAKIGRDIGLIWPRSLDEASEIDGFLTADLGHNSVSDAELGTSPHVHEWTLETYETLGELACAPQSSEMLARLDRVKQRFDQAGNLFGPLLTSAEARAQEQAQREVAIRSELSLEKSALEAATAENANLRATLVLRRSEAETLNLKLAAAEAEATAKAARIIQQAKENETLKGQFLMAEQTAARLHAQAERHGEALRLTRAQLVDAEAAGGFFERQIRRRNPFFGHVLQTRKKRKLALLLDRSGLFDSRWYLAKHKDVAVSGLAPAEHYLEHGFRQGYWPNPFFDTRWYLETYEDVRRSGINPLVHYLRDGWRENRDPSPLFRTAWYLESNPDVRASGVNPLAHFLTSDKAEGRLEVASSPPPVFGPLEVPRDREAPLDPKADPRLGDAEMHSGGVMTEIEPFVAPSARASLLTFGAQPHVQKGLEFGALNNPIVRPGQGDIRFVDYTSTKALKEHPHAPTINRDAIVNVDYIWSGAGSLADVIGSGELFDYAIASHVIEHVPDVVGWFKGIAEVLKPGAFFNLAIPDKRYTFDVRRKLTTLGELVEAHLLRFSHPSVRQMFDHCYDAVAIDPGAIWTQNIDVKALPRLCGDVALQLAYDSACEIVNTNRYFDSHCLIVTPISFLSLIEGLSRLKLFPLILRNFHPTQMGEFEFFASFQKPGEITPADLLEQQISGLLRQQEIVASAARSAALASDPGAHLLG